MSESAMRGKVVKWLAPWGAVPVENRVWPGTPDVAYANGLLELKWLRAWPKRDGTVVEIDHFTQEQRVFLKRWHRAGGTVHLLLQVRREWLLFQPLVAAEHVGRCTRHELMMHAHRWTDQGMNAETLLDWLCPNPLT